MTEGEWQKGNDNLLKIKDMRNFITWMEFSSGELKEIINLAISYKNWKTNTDLSAKILTLIFWNSSLRTRLSFESWMKKLKWDVNVLNAGDSWEFEYELWAVMNGFTQEHIKEAAKVISSYSDIIWLRKCDLMTRKSSVDLDSSWDELKKDLPINSLVKYSNVPIINMESNMHHPCQAMADMMTVQEQFSSYKKKYVLTWAPHPKALPLATPHSQVLIPSTLWMDVTLACPEWFELDADILDMANKNALAWWWSFNISNDQKEAINNADIVVAKSWASLKYFWKWIEEAEFRKKYTDWIVNEQKMNLTNNWIFMHCLPVRRNVEVTDWVLDSEASLHIKEAENRMWVQMAIINKLLWKN